MAGFWFFVVDCVILVLMILSEVNIIKFIKAGVYASLFLPLFPAFENTGNDYEKQKEMQKLEKSPHSFIIAGKTMIGIDAENCWEKKR